MQKQDYNPLVSIIVITYNSAQFVVETLESAKAQTYQNIELIVSDDASTDNTVEICNQWIIENESRFVNTKLLTVKKNTGVSANCNRGFFISNGEWIKLIAGDDLLMCDCINDNLEFINQHPAKDDINVISSRILYFNENIARVIDRTKPSILDHPQINVGDQFSLFCYGVGKRINSLLIRKSSIVKICGADELFSLQEDTSIIGKLLMQVNKFYFLDKDTFYYRIHDSSITGSKNKFLISDFDLQNSKGNVKYRTAQAGYLLRYLYKFIYVNTFLFHQLERSRYNFIANKILYFLLVASLNKILELVKKYKFTLFERDFNKRLMD